MKIKFLILTALLLSAIGASAAPQTGEYAGILEKYVDARGMVDYAGLKAGRRPLDAYVASLGSTARSEYDAWTDTGKIAFLINAYNAITLKVIIDHYPIEAGFLGSVLYPKNSIRQIDGAWKEITHKVLGQPRTLDAIEHEILRKQFNEPRIHMALVCAAVSCPKLRNEPYTGAKLDKQLADQSRAFVTNPAKNRIDAGSGELEISKIFDWFGDDFVGTYSDAPVAGLKGKEAAVLRFIAAHHSAGDRLLQGERSIDYMKYDWTLNEQ